jgi:hypothetical protein
MIDNAFVMEILREEFPIECETVGPTNLQDIVEAEVDFIPAEEGSYMDVGDAIGALALAATFVKTVVDMYIVLKKELGRKPQKHEIEVKITIPKKVSQNLDAKTREKLLKEIVQKLDKK